MKGNPRVLEALRSLLKYQLTSINQSFLHARMCLDWGYEEIAGQVRKASIDHMVFAEQLVDRILFLEGMPSLRDTYPVRVGTDVGQIHSYDLSLSCDTAASANEGIQASIEHEDDTSRELIESILKQEEAKIDWLESQLQIIRDTGLGIYLSRQMRD